MSEGPGSPIQGLLSQTNKQTNKHVTEYTDISLGLA